MTEEADLKSINQVRTGDEAVAYAAKVGEML